MSVFSEQMVIGAIIAEDNAQAVIDGLTPEMFTNPGLREVFSTITDMYWANEPIDTGSLLNRFPDNREWIVDTVRMYRDLGHVADHIRAMQEEWQEAQLEEDLNRVRAAPASLPRRIDSLSEVLAKHRELIACRSTDEVTSFSQAFSRFAQWLEEQDSPAPRTGFSRLDQITGGFLPGAVYTIAGRPGSGKTDFALNLAMQAVRSGARVLYFTLEMTNNQLMRRMTSRLLKINSVRVRDRTLTQEERRSVQSLLPRIQRMDTLSFLETPQISVSEVERYVDLGKPDIVVIDHIGLMKRPEARSDYRALGMVSNRLKALALDKKITVVQLCQMNRQIESRKGGRPTLSDLRESGDLEQDSDVVAFLVPEALDGRIIAGEDSVSVALDFQKVREGGQARVNFRWQPQYHEYTEVEERFG